MAEWVYVGFIIDVFSRRILYCEIRWPLRMSTRDTELRNCRGNSSEFAVGPPYRYRNRVDVVRIF